MAKTKRQQASNQLRIIGGKWRGRKLLFPDLEGLRPSGDRVRETVFNWLAPYLPGAHCLDLFAGSGAFAFECLSRGAGSVTALDISAAAIQQLRYSAQSLQTEQIHIEQANALQWLQDPPLDEVFDIVFLDPPFQTNLLERAAAALNHSALLAPEGLIYVETARDSSPQLPGDWRLTKHQCAGQVQFSLYCRE